MGKVRPGEHAASQSLAMLWCLCLGASFLSAPAYAEESNALKLVRSIQALQKEHGSYAPQVLPPLIELGTLYGEGQCEHALELLELALDISHRSEGLLDPKQLGIYSTLMNCYVTLDLPGELARAQRYVTLIHETQYEDDDPRLLAAIAEGARRYEEAGLYLSARKLHERAIQVARASGEDDLRLVPALRGMARAYRLEYTYGLALPDIVDPESRGSGLRSLEAERYRFDRRGQDSLEQAVAILRRYPEARSELVATLVDLGDWHQLAGHHRLALSIYREAWRELHATDVPERTADVRESELFRTATPLLFRSKNSHALRRAPPEAAGMRKYTIDLAYNVTPDGEPKDVAVIESNAPRALTQRAISDMKYVLHRPRLADGEPLEDQGLQYRRNIYSRSAKGD